MRNAVVTLFKRIVLLMQNYQCKYNKESGIIEMRNRE